MGTNGIRVHQYYLRTVPIRNVIVLIGIKKGRLGMGKRIEVKAGERYGRLVIVRETKRTSIKRRFLCQCDCGSLIKVNLNSLRLGDIKSCGCLLKESGKRNWIHGYWKHRLYGIWAGIKQRCLNPKCNTYKYYGARGITICQEWTTFNSFLKWALPSGYKNELTIERIDCNGNYKPGNCTWIPMEEQSGNTRRSHLLTWKGKTQNIAKWAKDTGLCFETIRRRIAYGWDIERALTESPHKVGAAVQRGN